MPPWFHLCSFSSLNYSGMVLNMNPKIRLIICKKKKKEDKRISYKLDGTDAAQSSIERKLF